jgi:hypothetical protein
VVDAIRGRGAAKSRWTKVVWAGGDDHGVPCRDMLAPETNKLTILRLGRGRFVEERLALRVTRQYEDEMGRAELYREHAEECLAFAKSIADPIWRAQLHAMAAQWREFAERESKIGGAEQQPTRSKWAH